MTDGSPDDPNVPPEVMPYGFAVKPVGAHVGKTMMLSELRDLFSITAADTPAAEIRDLVIEQNCLLKSTANTRKSTFTALRTLYALDPDCALYRLLRELWSVSPADQPLLAALLATARDPLLRSTEPWLTALAAGREVTWQDFAALLERSFPGRYTPASLKTTGQNIASTWTQAGLLVGKMTKRRQQPSFGPAATTMACALGFLCGLRGTSLLDSIWCRVLTTDAQQLHQAVAEASRAGLLVYRRIEDVVEIRLDDLLQRVGIADGQT